MNINALKRWLSVRLGGELAKVILKVSILPRSYFPVLIASSCAAVAAPAFLQDFTIYHRVFICAYWVVAIWMAVIVFAPIFDLLVRRFRLPLVRAVFIFSFIVDLCVVPPLLLLTAKRAGELDLHLQTMGVVFPLHFSLMLAIMHKNLEVFERHFLRSGVTVSWWLQKGGEPDPIEDLLPPDKRGPVILMQASGHHVQIHTTKGSHLIRCSFSSALQKMRPDTGHLVHRSYWVRKEEILRVFYENGNPKLETRSGQIIPVSRKAIERLKESLAAGGT